MKKAEALKIQAEIEQLCEKYGVWYDIFHEKKPELVLVKIGIALRVNDMKH